MRRWDRKLHVTLEFNLFSKNSITIGDKSVKTLLIIITLVMSMLWPETRAYVVGFLISALLGL